MADTRKIKIRGGTLEQLKTISLSEREFGITNDTKEPFVGTASGNRNLVDKSRIYVPVDYSDKAGGMAYFTKISGSGNLTYDSSESAMGKGTFAVSVGGGVWQIERFYPVAPLFGIGGHVCIKGPGTFSIGADFYDKDKVLLSSTTAQKNFLVNSIVGGGSFAAYKNYLISEGTGVNNFPVGARFIKPRITVSGNAIAVKVDAFIIYPGTFSILTDLISISKAENKIGDVKSSMLTLAEFESEHLGVWKLMDGQSCAGTAYAALKGVGVVPDMRGTVPRMKAHGSVRNPDGDLALGTYQADAYAAHTHQLDFYQDSGGGTYGRGNPVHGGASTNLRQDYIQNSGGNETRMKNITLNFFIKVDY